MKALINSSIKLFSSLILMVGTIACHSSKKTVKGSDGVSSQIIVSGDKSLRDNTSYSDIPQQIGALIEEAFRWLGVPYKYAGTTKRGVDCSGFTSQVFLKSLDVKIPRSSSEQQKWCMHIKKNELKPGDLVFFATGSNKRRVSHVGIYIGNGDMIHASSSRGVIVSNLKEKYYNKNYHSSGRPNVIDRLYAKASKNNRKNKSSERNDKEVIEFIPQNTTPSISLDELIEMQVDSVVSADEVAPNVIKSAPQPAPKVHSQPQIPPVVNEEPVDTIFMQFFD